MFIESILTALAVGAAVGYAAGTHRDRDGRDAVDRYLDAREAELRERYETTSMDYVEFEDRIAPVEDPHTERIMRDAMDVDGIGPETAFNVACRFDSYGDYREASRADYRDVNRVGDQKSQSLARRH